MNVSPMSGMRFALSNVACLNLAILAAFGLLLSAGCSEGSPSPPTPPQIAAQSESPAAARPVQAPSESVVLASNDSNVATPKVDAAAPSKPAAKGETPATKEVTFDEIKLDMKKEDPFDLSKLTDKVKNLDGKPIRIRGFILPGYQQSGIKQFILVRDNMECCFGPGALLHDCVLVEMIAPATTSFTTRPISVEGIFSVREVKGPDGKHLAIYHLDGTEVQ